MRKTKKRLFALLLSICMVISVIPVNALAEEPQKDFSSSYKSSSYFTALKAVNLTGNQREDIVNVALSQVGYREGSSVGDYGGEDDGPYNNYTEYNYWYHNNISSEMPLGGDSAPWCATFVSWCAEQANIPSSVLKRSTAAGHGGGYFNISFYSGSGTLATSRDDDSYFKGYYYTPQKGDLFFTRSWSHVGLVVAVNGSTVITVEGNTNTSGSAQGNGVYRLTSRRIADLYFGVPDYAGGSEPVNPSCSCSTSYAGFYTTSNVSTDLRIRSGHGSSYSQVGYIPQGATFYVSMGNGSWAHVEYNGISGYASMDYMTKTADALSAPQNVQASQLNMSLRVSFDSVPNATSYDVYMVQEPWGWEDIKYSQTTTGNAVQFDGVEAGYYAAFVIAKNGNLQSEQSAWNHVWIDRPAFDVSINANGGTSTEQPGKRFYGDQFVFYTGNITKPGYSIKGCYLYRPDDDKWYASGQGWFTEQEIAQNGYTKALYGTNGWVNMTIDMSFLSNAGNTRISSFVFCAVWEENVQSVNIWHWLFGLKANEGTNYTEDALRFKTTGFEVLAGLNFTMDTSYALNELNGVGVQGGMGTFDFDSGWTVYPYGSEFTMKNESIGFEFHYAPIEYTITYDLNGGTNASTNPDTYTVFYGVTLAVPTRSGWIFTGWKDQDGNIITGINQGKDMSSFAKQGDFFEALKAELAVRRTGNITLTATWQKEMQDVSIWHWLFGLKANEGSNYTEDALRFKTTEFEVRVGSNFAMESSHALNELNGIALQGGMGTFDFDSGWTVYPYGSEFTMKNESVGFEFHYAPIEYTITYDLNGGINASSNPDKYTVFYGVTLAEPTRSGWKFTGWKDQDGNIITGINQGKDMSSFAKQGDFYEALKAELAVRRTGNITLTATWGLDFGQPDFTLPAFLTEIAESAFEGITAKTVYIPDTCVKIGHYAFRDSGIQRIRIPADCSIASSAFDGCADVRIFGTPGSAAEAFCKAYANCTFIAE